ncbi:MAG: hypothetical protein MGG11_22935, partial [Trichodesmium sp. MAG_R03]|nr:hypothetical protein [Trichodesmium sp. MAG_R03]
WWVADPVDQYTSPYTYVGNSPLVFVDPDGKEGDYYDKEGNYLGHDNIEDDRAYVTTKESFELAKSARLEGLAFASVAQAQYIGSHSALVNIAATSYGESSTSNIYKEMAGIASVLFRLSEEGISRPAYAQTDGNIRYNNYMKSSLQDRSVSTGMKMAMKATINAVSGGTDYSKGAYWWDGADFGTNSKHRIRQQGFIYSNSAHNIYKVNEVSVNGIHYWKDAKGANLSVRGRWTYRYVSTSAHGGTIFWKLGSDYMKATGNKQGY